jgi:hypothetical protein
VVVFEELDVDVADPDHRERQVGALDLDAALEVRTGAVVHRSRLEAEHARVPLERPLHVPDGDAHVMDAVDRECHLHSLVPWRDPCFGARAALNDCTQTQHHNRPSRKRRRTPGGGRSLRRIPVFKRVRETLSRGPDATTARFACSLDLTVAKV